MADPNTVAALALVGLSALIYVIVRWKRRRKAANALRDAAEDSGGEFDEMLDHLESDDRVEVED